MAAKQYDKKEFIETIRSKVYELHKDIIYIQRPTTNMKKFIEHIVSCMNYLWELERTDRGWIGVTEDWKKTAMDDDVAINVIRDKILPHLQAAAAFENFIDENLWKMLTDLVQVVENWFATSRADDTVNELKSTDINTRVEELEKEVQELRAQVQELLLQNPPKLMRQALLRQLVRHT